MQIGIGRREIIRGCLLCAAATTVAVPTFSGSCARIPLHTTLRACRKSQMPKINRDGVEIYYEVHGSGPPLLLTHGYSSTSEMWKGQIAALSKHHKLVLWDMRGHGRSD